MSKSTDFRLVEVSFTTENIAYRTPIKFGGRVVTDATLLNVSVKIESRDGKSGSGFGSMPMGNVWAWPTNEVSTEQTLQALVAFGEKLVALANDYQEFGDPLQVTHALEEQYQSVADQVQQELSLAQSMPILAQLVAASPLEAAIHDAFGVMLNENSYNLLSAEYCNQDLSAYLNSDFQGEYLDQYTLRTPKKEMPLYHLVGALDPLTDAEIKERLNDGMPETLGEWILADGLTHLKIKLNGDDLNWDVQRVIAVENAAAEAQAKRSCKTWCYSLDFNEKCENVEYVLDFLAKIQEQAPQAFDRVQYIEQPTHRDLKAYPDNKMHKAAEIKPVVIDESLNDLESLLLARELGYSGVALKACKGHTGALLMGAAAQKYNLFLCVQDLTCPGASFLHSASLSARIPTVAAIEGNGRQYCPAGNKWWDEKFPEMFQVNDGTLGTHSLTGPGVCLGNLSRPPK